MSALGTDLKVALRTLRKTPATSLLAVVVLGLGIGANSAMFSLVNTLVVRPLPVREPGRLLNVLAHDVEERDYRSVSYPNFVDLRDGVRAFDYKRARSASATFGVIAAAGVARLLQSFLFGVDASDPAVFLTAFGLLAGVAVLASLGPAGRASRLDPLVALRVD